MVAPFTELLKKNSFLWIEKATRAFMELKAEVTTPLVLKLPHFYSPFTIKCDASRKSIGAALMQTGHPLAYLSKALKGTELLMLTYEKELLTLVTTVIKWCQSFVVKTNQQALKFLLEQVSVKAKSGNNNSKNVGLYTNGI